GGLKAPLFVSRTKALREEPMDGPPFGVILTWGPKPQSFGGPHCGLGKRKYGVIVLHGDASKVRMSPSWEHQRS
ncbi:MAG: hypothetical protein EBT06_14370, partial [Gammaproteobacteria bacterium]|nr:hypothetical protein [Gammaproteobacteria bacterium]